jgi:hypothetical protein
MKTSLTGGKQRQPAKGDESRGGWCLFSLAARLGPAPRGRLGWFINQVVSNTADPSDLERDQQNARALQPAPTATLAIGGAALAGFAVLISRLARSRPRLSTGASAVKPGLVGGVAVRRGRTCLE